MNVRPQVLVGFTPTHLIPMLEIARSLPAPVQFFHPEAQRIATAARGGLEFLGGCEHPSRSRWQKYAGAATRLRRILRRGESAVVCVPHPFNPLSNLAFFAPGVEEIRIYQDGILNYYDAPNPFGRAQVLLGRSFRAALIGVPYRAYAGHLSGIEARRITAGYFTHPERIVLSGMFDRLHRLDFGKVKAIEVTENVGTEPVTLFLDQPVEALMPRPLAKVLRERAFDFAESLGHRVLYKPHYVQHPPWPARPGWILASAEERFLPAEELLYKRPVASIVSFWSSALASIAFLHPKVECVAVGAASIPLKIDGRATTMADLLSGFGVRTID
jgi:hypothetical protein